MANHKDAKGCRERRASTDESRRDESPSGTDVEYAAAELESLRLDSGAAASATVAPSARQKQNDAATKDGKKKGRFWAAFKLKSRFGSRNPDQGALEGGRRDALPSTSSHRLHTLQSRSPLLSRVGRGGVQRRAMGAGPGAVAGRLRHTSMRELMRKVPPPPSAVELPADLVALFPHGEFPTHDIDELRIIQRARDMELGMPVGGASAAGGGVAGGGTRGSAHYLHCLVPALADIAAFPSYWGVMDRYEAEDRLDGRPEGSFVLRDSAQDDYLFSVTFRRYGLTLHARLEQWAHRFSFNTHDPGVYADASIADLLAHYRYHDNCLFFEPLLTTPIRRNFVFSLQHLCRATICDRTTYDGIDRLPLPATSKEYLQYYHYKQKVRAIESPPPTVNVDEH